MPHAEEIWTWRMEFSLTDADLLVRIAAGIVVIAGTVFGWVIVLIRRQWSRTEEAFKEKMSDMSSDHKRDIDYYTMRHDDDRETIAELKADLITERARLRECEDRHRYPPGVRV